MSISLHHICALVNKLSLGQRAHTNFSHLVWLNDLSFFLKCLLNVTVSSSNSHVFFRLPVESNDMDFHILADNGKEILTIESLFRDHFPGWFSWMIRIRHQLIAEIIRKIHTAPKSYDTDFFFSSWNIYDFIRNKFDPKKIF